MFGCVVASRALRTAVLSLLRPSCRRSAAARLGAGPAPERAGAIRFLCAVAVVVAVVLRGRRRARRDRSARQQCGARPYSFVVHGLWPQYEKGFPEFCQMPAPRLDRDIVSSMLDLMPAPRLIFNEWDKHGTCSGLTPRAYFETVRKARAVVKIPPDLYRSEGAAHRHARRGRGGVRQGQSGTDARAASR